MNKKLGVIVGALLILGGAVALIGNFTAHLLDLSLALWAPWRLWPMAVIGIGLFLTLLPFLRPEKRGLGSLFIPGLPLLTTGGILLFSSMFNAWGAWAYLWPLEVIALGAGFLGAAVFMRVIWLLIPAFVIGANGLLLLFCAVTGFWEIWAALWTIEPLSLGLAFLVIQARKKNQGLLIAGLILAGTAAVGLIGMSAILRGNLVINLLGPAVLVLVGLGLLLSTLNRNTAQKQTVQNKEKTA